MNDYTDKGNSIGHWPSGWLNGEWKCFHCQTIIGKNLKGGSPQLEVCAHAVSCEKRRDNMTIYMLSWFGLVDLDYAAIPLGVFRTQDDAIRAVDTIGPDLCRNDGTITLYRTSFPGFFIGAIPKMEWNYETTWDNSDNKIGVLSDPEIIGPIATRRLSDTMTCTNCHHVSDILGPCDKCGSAG